MWLKPLGSEFNGESLNLYATNHFILDWVRDKYHGLITESLRTLYGQDAPNLIITVRSISQQNSQSGSFSGSRSSQQENNRHQQDPQNNNVGNKHSDNQHSSLSSHQGKSDTRGSSTSDNQGHSSHEYNYANAAGAQHNGDYR
eukprot:CAMPEP_0182873988 /NCGR_PEP_ID=MMETSP0034_2-20130328/12665_1 /TAXON_ID=156128 /ORGANISM="Nephroselmis pyriformis, Strain CCMP717" /LENGTH=142 /DNA_ID=CAMNT_0025006679 /DNA_START=297 /DNA_END=721 /DNA_ORIENTATION=-